MADVLRWYRYYQNNSYGVDHVDPHTGIGKMTYVQAVSPAHADNRAEELGLYFDENFNVDCDCCGTRWSRQDTGYGEDSYEDLPGETSGFCSPAYAHPIEGPFFEIPVRAGSGLPVIGYGTP
jgi:hypothetical protein